MCNKNPCLHHGRCFVDDNYIDGYFCKCPKNYKGVRCQRKFCMTVATISQSSLTIHKLIRSLCFIVPAALCVFPEYVCSSSNGIKFFSFCFSEVQCNICLLKYASRQCRVKRLADHKKRKKAFSLVTSGQFIRRNRQEIPSLSNMLMLGASSDMLMLGAYFLSGFCR